MSSLLEHPLFAGVSEDAVQPLLAGIEPYELPRSRVVDDDDTPPGLVHLVFAGRLGVFVPVPGGRPMLLETVGSGGLDGLLRAAGYVGHFSRVEDPSLIASVPLAILWDIAAREARLYARLFELLLGKLARREWQLEALAQRGPSERLARQLLGLCDTLGVGEWVELGLSHQTLADMVALRRETVTLHLQRLARTGALRADGRRYRLNRPVLERLVRGS